MPETYVDDIPTAPTRTAGFGEVIGAAVSLFNPTSNYFQALSKEDKLGGLRDFQRHTPGYSPFSHPETLRGFEDFRSSFIGSNSPQETDLIKENIMREQENIRVLSSRPVFGFFSTMAASAIDPTSAIPFFSVASKARSASRLVNAGRFAVAGVGAATTQEAFLQANQETRTGEESALSVIGAGVISGALGGIIKPLSTSQAVVNNAGAQVSGTANPTPVSAPSLSYRGSVQKAGNQLYTRLLNANPATEQLLREKNPVFKAILKAQGFFQIAARWASSHSSTARVVLRRTVNTGLISDESSAATGLVDVTSAIAAKRMSATDNTMSIHKTFDDYVTGGGKLSFEQLEAEAAYISRNKAPRSGLAPDVAAAAQKMSATFDEFYAPVTEDGEVTGALMPSRVAQARKTAVGQFPRMWNQEKLADPAEERDLVDFLTRHFSRKKHKTAKNARIEAQQIVDRARKTDDFGFAVITEAGMVKERSLDDILDNELERWLINSPTEAIRRTTRQLTPQLEWAKSHGTIADSRLATIDQDLGHAVVNGDVDEMARINSNVRDYQAASIIGRTISPEAAADVQGVFKALDAKEVAISALSKGLKGSTSVNTTDKIALDLLAGKVREVLANNKSSKVKAAIRQLVTDPNELAVLDKAISSHSGASRKLGGYRETAKALDKRFSDILNEKPKFSDFADQAEQVVLQDRIANYRYSMFQDALENKGLEEAIAKELKAHPRESRWILGDFKSMRASIIGAYGSGVIDAGHAAANLTAAARNLTAMYSLQGITISALTDTAMPLFQHGWKNFWASARSTFSSINWRKMLTPRLIGGKPEESMAGIKDQFLAMVGSAEMAMSAHGHRFGESFMDSARAQMVVRHSRSGQLRGISEKGATATMRLTSFDRHTGVWSTAAGGTASHVIIGVAEKVAMGKALTKSEKNILGVISGLDERLLARIHAQVVKHGEVDPKTGLRMAHTRKWTDRFAREQMEAAITAEIHRTILRPNVASGPRLIHSNLGSMLLMFRKFGLDATNKILLSGIQRGEAQILAGATSLLSLGAAITALQHYVNNRDLPNDVDFAEQAITRSGILGIYGDVAGNVYDLAMSRRNLSSGAIFGAAAGLSENAGKAIVGSFKGEFTQADLDRDLAWIPWWRVYWWRRMTSSLSESIGQGMGLKPRQDN